MSKFKAGDVVVVVGVTDIDGEYGDAGALITDPEHEGTLDWQSPPQTMIGQIGTVVEAAINDYYDLTVKFPWNAENEDCAMKEQDLKRVKSLEYRVTGTVPTPMYNPKRPVFDHDESTRPPRNGKASAPRQNGEAGRVITVTTRNEKVAESLASVWRSKDSNGKPLFEDVNVRPVAVT